MGCITGLNLVKTFASLHEKLNNIEHKLSVERISRESSPLTKVILRVHYKNYHSGKLDYLFQTQPEFRALIIKSRAGLKNSFIIIITIHIDGEKTRKEVCILKRFFVSTRKISKQLIDSHPEDTNLERQ